MPWEIKYLGLLVSVHHEEGDFINDLSRAPCIICFATKPRVCSEVFVVLRLLRLIYQCLWKIQVTWFRIFCITASEADYRHRSMKGEEIYSLRWTIDWHWRPKLLGLIWSCLAFCFLFLPYLTFPFLSSLFFPLSSFLSLLSFLLPSLPFLFLSMINTQCCLSFRCITVIRQVYTLFYAQHKCSYDLSPYIAVKVPLTIFLLLGCDFSIAIGKKENGK